MYEKRIKLLILVLAVCLIGSIVLTFSFAGKPVSFVVDSCKTAEGTYLVDDNGDEISILKISKKGDIDGQIKKQKIKGDKITTYDHLVADGTNIYVYKIVKNIKSNKVISEEILFCDFEKEKLISTWELPVLDTEAQNSFAPSVKKGELYYFTIKYDNKNFMAQAVLNHMSSGERKPVIEAYVNYDIGIGFSDFYYTDSGEIVFTTPEGKIFKGVEEEGTVIEEPILGELVGGELVEENPPAVEIKSVDVEAVAESQMQEEVKANSLVGTMKLFGEQIYPKDQGIGGTMTGFTPDGKNTVYFIDLADGKYKGIDISKNKELDLKIKPFIEGIDFNITTADLKNVRFSDENSFTATMTNPEGKTCLAVFEGEEGKLFYKLKETGGTLFLLGILYFIGLAVASIILYILWELFLMLTRGRIPIVTKVIGICIPVVIISVFVLQTMINSMFVGQSVDNQYKELYLISRQQSDTISSQLVSEIDIRDPYKNMYYYELRGVLNALPSSSNIYAQGEDINQKVYDFGYHWLYKVENKRLVSIYCGQNYINVPIDYYYDGKTSSMFYEALQKKKTIKGSFRDAGGEWIVLAIPVMDENGKVVAIMETGTTKASLEYAVNKNTEKINMANLAILAILILTLSALMFMCLSPLRKLKYSVNEIIEGNLGIQTKVRGRDEVAEIGAAFNQMSTSIKVSVNELERLNQGYYKFVPSKMFNILRKSSVTDVRLGDQINSQITILTLNSSRFEKIIGELTADQMFRLINGVYSTMVPIVGHKGGVVDKFEKAGLVAFFTKGCEDALDTAISTCQAMELFNQIREKNGEEAVEITAGISYGPVMVGIVGHEERLAATTVSEHTNLSGFLRKIGTKYGARVLTTGATLSRIKDFEETYSTRYIGFINIKSLGETEKLYDVFDGDNEEMKLFKKQTKEIFEKGVDLYCERYFYEARLVFIEVLKQNRNDKAAQEYLYRCDQNYQSENQEQIEIFIEKY